MRARGGGSNQSKVSCPFDGQRPQGTETRPRLHSKSRAVPRLDPGGVVCPLWLPYFSTGEDEDACFMSGGRGPPGMAMAGLGPQS